MQRYRRFISRFLGSLAAGLALGTAAVGLSLAEDAPPAPVESPAPPDAETASAPEAAAPEEEQPSHAVGALIPIKDEITDVTVESLRRRIELARAGGATIIVFELNTPGGMVSSALDICDTIKNLVDIKTVAWVHTQAFSAGSMIAMACDEIVMSPASTIGDCGVILGGPTGPEEVPEELRAKAESPVLEQFRDSAARHGYDSLLCESLVVKEHVVYWIEHKETGERRFVDKDDKVRLVGGDSDAKGFARPSEENPDAYDWKLVESYIDPVTGKQVPLGQPVVKPTELLTMSQSKASAFGFCKHILTDASAVQTHYNISTPLVRYETTWSEDFTGWLTSMPVRMFLLVIILLGAYVEFHTPGVGVPGLVALICLGIFVGAPYLTGLANVWEIVIILIGFALLAVEIFVIPGFGVTGLAGIICILVGLLATFIPDEPGRTFPIYWPQMEQGLEGLKTGLIVLASSSAAAVVAMIMFSRVMPHLTWLHGVIPPNPTAAQATVEDPYHGYARLGDIGAVETTLRPSGKARFGDVLVDVVTEGEFVEPPAEVRVVERAGNRVVVRRAT